MSDRAAIYTRLSKDRSGLSENTGIQLRECRQYAADAGWEVVWEAQENDVSASRYSKKSRPLYEQLIGRVITGEVDVILATESERLVRRPEEMGELIRLAETTSLKRIALTNDGGYDLTDADGIYRARTAVALAERESRKISTRQRRKKAAQARDGKPTGGRRAYGYEADGVTLNEAEAPVLREMGNLVLKGWSFRDVAYWANENEHKTSTGKLFYPVTVRNMLLKPRYGGIRQYYDEQYPAVWPPVFDPVTWERLQLTLKARQEANGEYKSGTAPIGLLHGLAYCGGCDLPLNCRHKQDRPDSANRRIYYCRVNGDTERERGCGKVVRGAEPLEHFITELVLFRLDTPALGKLVGKDDGELAALLSDRQAAQARLDGLGADYGAGLLTRQQLAAANRTAQAELKRLDDQINKSQRTSIAVPLGETLRSAWEQSPSLEWKRSLLGLVITKIVVRPGNTKPFYEVNGKQYRFDPELIEISWLA